jgi:type IV pilus assembly protein PilA
MRKSRKGFTLIELLVVVAIIGILAAVGIPIFQGFLATAKVNAATENHTRSKDMITAYFAKCSTGSSTIQLKVNSTTTMTNVSCTSSMSQFATNWSRHFNNDGWQNPYNKSSTFSKVSNGNPAQGAMHFYYSGNSLLIKSNVGTDAGGNKFINSSVLKE